MTWTIRRRVKGTSKIFRGLTVYSSKEVAKEIVKKMNEEWPPKMERMYIRSVEKF